MPSEQDIADQQKLLQQHRQTLTIYLDQEAALGKEHTPPGVRNGILAARTEIKRIKATLRDWGQIVDDHPNDTIPQQAQFSDTPGYIESLILRIGINLVHSSEKWTQRLLVFNLLDYIRVPITCIIVFLIIIIPLIISLALIILNHYWPNR